MMKVTTSLKKLLVANALYEKGIDGSLTFEKGKLAMKAFATTKPDVEAHEKTNKLKAEEYNRKLEDVKTNAKADGSWDWKKESEVTVPQELLEERRKLMEEVQASLDQDHEIQFGDDNYRAMLDVCINAQKSWYKVIQEKNECTDQDKREKMVGPSMEQFSSFSDFIEDLEGAEKVKEGKKE